MAKLLATLDPEGFVGNPAAVASKLTVYFYLANYSQSTMYRGSVASLAYLMALHTDQPTQLCRSIESTLSSYLKQWFDDLDITVEIENEQASRLNLILSAIVRDDGKTYEFKHLITTSGTQLSKVLDLVNDNILFELN